MKFAWSWSWLLCAALAALAAAVSARTQGVADEEIVLGTIQDLSGSLAAQGKQVRLGMQLRLDEANAQGGVHGRKLVLRVEDSAYDPKRAVLAAQKLVQHDRIFAMVGHLGSANNMAAMPVQFEKNVANFLPVAPAREMVEPAHRLKLGLLVSSHDQVRQGLPRLIADRGARSVCAVFQDDEFGLDALRGAHAALAALDMPMAESTSYKRGATDFSTQVARLKARGCDLIVLATGPRETVAVMAESTKTGFAPTFMTTVAAYHENVPKLGGAAVNGLYATMVWPIPYLDDESPAVREWAGRFKQRFGESAEMAAIVGYVAMDVFVRAATRAGRELSTDSLIAAMDGLVVAPDRFGGPELSWSPNKRLGSDASRLSKLVDGRWKVVSSYAQAR